MNAEVSPDGTLSVAAYTTDYLQKTVPSNYSNRGRTYDYEGTNRCTGRPCEPPEDDVAEPASGYLWDLAQRAGITFRNYGEFVIPEGIDPESHMPAGYKGSKPFRAGKHEPCFPYDLNSPTASPTLTRRVRAVSAGWPDERLIVLRLRKINCGRSANAPDARAYLPKTIWPRPHREAVSRSQLEQHRDLRLRRRERARSRRLARTPYS